MGMVLVGLVPVPILVLHYRAGTVVALMAVELGLSCCLLKGASIF